MTDDASTSSDGIIRQMSDTLANKIAAGEVVQRPASVAKELIENALDAGASSVEAIFKDAGRTLVQIVDDGCGMSPDDAVRCFDRHATSKIRSVDDLERIRTLGFRGEALASIAAVAHVELKTKRVEDDAGTLVKVDGGELTENRPCAAPNGTSIAVRNLFYNVPARRNFLKTDATELKHLSETFQFLALSNPHVAFQMTHNGHAHHDLSAARSKDFFDATRQRIVGLMGEKYEGSLLGVDDASSDLTLRGFVRRPSTRVRGKSDQFLFVNDRYVQNRYLAHAVRKAYGDLLPDKTFPFFALFLSMDPRRVDVNVHPTKAEVKFDDDSGVYGFIKSAVERALRGSNLSPDVSSVGGDRSFSPGTSSPTTFQTRGGSSDADDDASGGSGPSASNRGRGNGRSRGEAGTGTSRPGQRRSSSGFSSRQSGPRSSGQSQEHAGRPASNSPVSRDGSSRRRAPGEQSTLLYNQDRPDATSYVPRPDDAEKGPIWTLHGRFLMTPTDDGVRLIDQRAAHQRVLYERALSRLGQERGESQQLLFPQTVDLTPADAELLGEIRSDLEALGFDLESMSGRTVVVRGVPVDVRDGDETSALMDMLEPMRSAREAVDDERRKALARALAQQGAVRRGQTLSEAERRALLRDLYGCDMPYADPTGTPTMVHLSMDELAKRLQG